jgi:hypothetical protein
MKIAIPLVSREFQLFVADSRHIDLLQKDNH